jgi:uncharacterized membrane protein
MTIHFSYNKKQVIQALRYHFITRREIKLLLIFVNVFAILSAVLFYFKEIQPISFLIFSGLWILLMLVIWWFLPSGIYKKAHTFQDSFDMSFNDNDVSLRSKNATQSWPWNTFSTFVETPYFFHLYFDTRSFFLIPKDAFENIEDIRKVRDLIKSRIKK